MSRSFWAAVGTGVCAFALTPAAAFAASPGHTGARPATTHVSKSDSHPVPIIHHIVPVTPPPLARVRRRAISRVRQSAARAVARGHVVLLAAGNGYSQAAGSTRVRVLQRHLAGLGFAPGPVDGRYGPLTTAAVERFQSAADLTVDGVAGAHTLAALNASAGQTNTGLRPGAGYRQASGSRRARVLQRRLAGLGFAPGPVDGRYGPLTTRAVERFQTAHHLTVSGVVGAGTLRALGPVGRRSVPIVSRQGHPDLQSRPVVPHGHVTPVRSVAATHPPALPVTLVLLALAALGVSTVLLSYGQTRSRVRRQPPRGVQMPQVQGPELVSAHDHTGQNGGSRR
jgi:peptidoglycan hydrolase-like protein with peptidoglycan-binding domain